MRCALLRFRYYISIVLLLLSHVQQKWKIYPKKLFSIISMIILGIFLQLIASFLFRSSVDMFNIGVTSISIVICGIAILMINSETPISRILYELKYFKRMYTFMIECYQNLLQEYRIFLKIHKLDGIRSNKSSKDLTVISIIFFKIFQMYFAAMDVKHKNSEPYLIDTQEMENLYRSGDFNNFYSTLFFDAECKNSNTSYEQILIHILEEVMTALYQKSWFVDYYDEYTIFQLIKHILTHWYGNVVQYSINDTIAEGTLN